MSKLELVVHLGWNGDEYRTMNVTFYGEQAAVDYWNRYAATRAMFLAEGTGVPETWTRFEDLMFPTCHHGMDGNLCQDPDGPHHYGTREQEMYWEV